LGKAIHEADTDSLFARVQLDINVLENQGLSETEIKEKNEN